MLKKVRAWSSDYLYLLKGHTQVFLYRKPPNHYLSFIKEGKVPIVCIPGVFESWQVMKSIADDISKDGHPVYVIPELKDNLKSIPDSAFIVEKLIKQNKLHNVIIVAHSKGGLIGKYLLAYLNENKSVKGVIAIATPFSGTKPARFIKHAAIQEFSPQSDVILDLQRKAKVNNKIISIYPEFDNHIWSEAGSYLDGALDNIAVKTQGHHKVIFQ
jgi:pimeloyl-ACP methyl ester carboxylesterase